MIIVKKRNFFLFLILILVTASLFFSCAGGKANNANELRFGITTEPITFDPLNPGNSADGRSILFNVFEGLVKPDSSGILRPCLAESWIIEPDSLVYTFFLREGARFHDGSILDSSDIKFSLETAMSMGFTGLGNIQEVLAEGANTVKIVLKLPDPEFLPYLTIGIVKAGNLDREEKRIGTGPFYIDSYTTQRNLVLKKFEKYWRYGYPHLDKVTIVFFENFDSLMTALLGGGIDGVRVTGSLASQIDYRKFDIINSSSATAQLLALNNIVPPLDDARVRKAINYGIDLQNIIDTAFFGAGSPSGSPLIPGLTLYYENSLEYPYNPDLARSLLAQAGFDGERREFVLEITVPSNYAMHVDTAQVIASQLEKIGVRTIIKLVDWNTWLSDVYFGRQYMSTIISLDSATVSPKGFLSRYYSNASGNFINYKNAEYDKIFDKALVEPNEGERVKLYKAAQRDIADNAASVFIQDIVYFMILRKDQFGGFLNYPLYVIDFASIYKNEIVN